MEKKTALSEEKKQWLIVAAIILVGILVRLLFVGRYPAGLNQDEASAGYDAFAVLNYGIDRNGIHNPMHLIAWGSGQNMAYSWLCMPFIALFGLSAVTVRVPMAIVGSISVALFYFFLKNIRGEDKRLVYLGTFLFAVFPWHIMKSRWGLESNLFPELILWGVVLLSFFLKNRKGIFLYLGYFLFGFSAYAYGSAYCFLPFFVLPLTVYLYCTKRAELRQLFLAMLILAVVVLPDILVLGKALTGGYIGHAATVANHKVYDAFYSDDDRKALMHGPTFMGNALACAAALKGIEIFEREDYMSKIARIEAISKREMLGFADPRIKEVRVMGGCTCVEVYNEADLEGFQQFAYERGVFSRPFLKYMYSMVPYVIQEDELVRIFDVMKEWFRR